MNAVLTKGEVQAQIERFLQNGQSSPHLARWAFERFCDIEEELLVAETEHAETIAAVLDELMWADSEPFVITKPAAAALLERLASPERRMQYAPTDEGAY